MTFRAFGVLWLCALLQASPPAAAAVSGFGFCAPPVVPACIDHATATMKAPDRESCAIDVQRFTRSLGNYRLCLATEMSRAIRSGNDAISRFRCRVDPTRTCP